MFAAMKVNAPRVVSGVAILAVAVATGWISYSHIYDLSIALHQPPTVARLMPVGIDGLIVVGSMALLEGGLLGWLGIGPGVAISLFANAESGIRYGWLAAVWAGVPAVSFALASFILERWVSGQARASRAASENPQPVTETEKVADTERADAPEPDARPVAPRSDRKPKAAPRPARVGMTLEEAADAFAAEVDSGALPSLRAIQTRARAGRPRAQAIRTHLESLVQTQHLEPLTQTQTHPSNALVG